MNIAILLTAGHSTRCKTIKPKQLIEIDNIPIFMHSVNELIKVVNKIIIVTNDTCHHEIINQTKQHDNIIIIINNENHRLKSIQVGLNHAKSLGIIDKIIIHDSARPFVKKNHFETLINVITDNIKYAQYYMKLTNGLMNIKKNKIVNRDDYIEICTPLCMNFDLCYDIFYEYIVDHKYYEFIPILIQKNIKYELIEEHYNVLRKITTDHDLTN